MLAGSLDAQCDRVNRDGAMTFHGGALWLADASCQAGEGARVQAFDASTGAASAFATVPARQPGDTKARGFSYPTGITFDRQGRLFVMDGGSRDSRWLTSFSALNIPPAGFGSGIWQVTSQGMRAFAGVALNTAVDGVGEAAGFVLANGLVIDAADNFYTRDIPGMRKITPDAAVTSLGVSSASAPVVDSSGHVYGVRQLVQASELVDLASGAVLATMPTPGYLVVMDAQDNIYAATTISNNSSDAQVIYRRARDGTQFEPILTNVQYLNSMATDDAGNLYLHQRHAIVKVEFTQ